MYLITAWTFLNRCRLMRAYNLLYSWFLKQNASRGLHVNFALWSIVLFYFVSVVLNITYLQNTPDIDPVLDYHPAYKNVVIAAGFSGKCPLNHGDVYTQYFKSWQEAMFEHDLFSF